MSRWSTPGEAYSYETGYIEGMADAKEKQWIPVTERLPEPYIPVLISVVEDGCDYVKCGLVRSVGIIYRRLEWIDDSGFPVKAVAWMPLPEPYQAERREDG